MQLTARQRDQATVIAVEGRLDALSAPALRQYWDDVPTHQRYVLDLNAVSFIDSMGLSTLVTGLKRARAAGGDVILVAPSQPVRVILELTRLDQVFVIAPDEAAGLAAGLEMSSDG